MLPALPTLAQLQAAADIVYAVMPPTPQYTWPLLAERLGAQVWVKHENHTPTGAFKVRGGLVYLHELLRRDPTVKGVISATRGNHGQSIGLAARRHGIGATIVVPHGNSVEKNAAMRALGVELIEHGEDFQESREFAAAAAHARGLHMVPSYHSDLVRGVASYWTEMFHAVPDLSIVFVPIGMGSGICAAVAARAATGARCKIVGVVAELAPAYALSFRQRRRVEAPAKTVIADGMACRVPDDDALALIVAHVDDIVTVSDEAISDAMKMLYTDTHNVAEGAGAAALAAALQWRPRLAGQRVGLSLSGGNVDADVFTQVLSRRLPSPPQNTGALA